MSLNERQILTSWERNATPWSAAVREDKIESRTSVTNSAALEAIGPGEDRAALDLGCGEGWLSRAMSQQGWRVVGVDGSPALIEAARLSGPEEYVCLDYSRLHAELPSNRFDLVVCNFSLLGEESTSAALHAAAKVLKPGGQLVIQTVHPISLDGPYRSGWKTEDWAGFEALDCEPSPWYFHTLSDWLTLLREAGFILDEVREPMGEEATRPSSLMLLAVSGESRKNDQ